jgi:hypothetical protein
MSPPENRPLDRTRLLLYRPYLITFLRLICKIRRQHERIHPPHTLPLHNLQIKTSGSLLCHERASIISLVTQKEFVLDAINELPDEASLDEIAARIEFLAATQKGIDQLDRDEGISDEEVKRRLAAWLTS